MERKKPDRLKFVRKFSICLFKNKRLLLGEADFSKDFIRTDRGDKYPALFSEGEYTEATGTDGYTFDSVNGKLVRLLGHLSPYAVYEAVITKLDGECGFAFQLGEETAVLALKTNADGCLSVVCGGEELRTGRPFVPGTAFSVQPRKSRFDVYLQTGDIPECLGTFVLPAFEDSDRESVFLHTAAGFYCAGKAKLRKVSFFMDSGISQADIRAVRYENGEVLTENGRMFFTVSIRLEEGACQGVFSWIPGTEEFRLTGALFFDAGDGVWGNDVATSLHFDRRTGDWLLWVCAFSHGHILGRARFRGDPRYGKNVIDITLLPPFAPGDDDRAFKGKKGDEDPDLFYDEKEDRWLLSVCRCCSEGGYRYFFFESSSPLDGFTYIGQGLPGDETGGSFIPTDGGLCFVCGNSFQARSDYRVYDMKDLSRAGKLTADYPDGGFRGWGTVFTVPQGTREKTYWLTFDRHKGSEWNWSYGNLYCFEAEP